MPIVSLKTQLEAETIAAGGVLLMVVKWGAMPTKICDPAHVGLLKFVVLHLAHFVLYTAL